MNAINVKITDEYGNKLPLSALSIETFAQMREQEKPDKKEPEPLKHWDCGWDCDDEPCMAVELDSNGKLYDTSKCRVMDTCCFGTPTFHVKTKAFNVGDELKMLSEDLEEFEVTTTCASTITVRMNSDGRIEINPRNVNYTTLDLATAKEFSQKFRQVIATMERNKDG